MNLRSTLGKFRVLAREARIVYRGFKTLKRTKQTPDQSYYSMRKLFILTNGRSNDVISKLISTKYYKDVDFRGILGIESERELDHIVNDITENGYHVFKQKLPAPIVDSIYNYAISTPCRFLSVNKDKSGYSDELVKFDESNPVSARYEFTQQQILECNELLNLIFDSSLLAVAQKYLKTKPFLDLIAMWWSAPFHGVGKSEAAQMYHFDLDRIKFIKFFFYITDVDSNTGPHCYVKKSHKRLPVSLLKDGRLSDSEVEQAFGRENMMELGGTKGTIIAVDTRGLHKGKDLLEGKRLLFQIEFSNSMFGQYYPPCSKPNLKPELEKKFQKYSYTYEQIMSH